MLNWKTGLAAAAVGYWYFYMRKGASAAPLGTASGTGNPLRDIADIGRKLIAPPPSKKVAAADADWRDVSGDIGLGNFNPLRDLAQMGEILASGDGDGPGTAARDLDDDSTGLEPGTPAKSSSFGWYDISNLGAEADLILE